MKYSVRLIKIISGIAGILFFTVTAIGFVDPNPVSDNPRTIEITGNDYLRFDVSKINAKPGETIRIVFKVKSSMPADAMSHNVIIVKSDVPLDEFVNESMKAAKNEYLAPQFEADVIAATAMIGGGKTSEITFTVPDEPGIYPYVCTFPGHFAAGMSGELMVEE